MLCDNLAPSLRIILPARPVLRWSVMGLGLVNSAPGLWSTIMEVFSLIKSSLGSEDTNPIHRLYRVGQQVGVCGQENVWRIHEAESIEEEKVSGSHKSQSYQYTG